MTVSEHWARHARLTPDKEAIVHWSAGEAPYRWRWGPLAEAAAQVAANLSAQGVKKGEVCAIIIRHHKDFYPVYMGVCAMGALPAVLAYPNERLHPDKFREGLAGMAQKSGLDWVLTESELEPVLKPLLINGKSTIRGLLFPLPWCVGQSEKVPVFSSGALPSDPCLLQHSSGTTGLQKAVMLSHSAVVGHVERYSRSIKLDDKDRIVSWLPFYHDMGLIAALYVPLIKGITLIQLDPFEWIKAPVLLLEAISQEGATVTWLPNFAYNLMADRIHAEDLEGLRLGSMRLFVNCSEPVRAESHAKFFERFSGSGLKREVLGACYAMAETTFAATQTVPGVEARSLSIDLEKLATGTVCAADGGKAKVCVSSGQPIADCELRILGASGEELPEDRVGEIAIRSVSLFSGYRNNAEKTAEVLKGGWYLSGDYGFRHDGEYYVIGRKKDVIIVAGKNIYPEDIEDAASGVAGVIPGRVVAFGVEDIAAGTEQICVIAEANIAGETEKKDLRRAILEAGMRIDVTISQVFLVPPRWLIKSSSGKPSRKANKARVLEPLLQGESR
jgi:acyl-CoA synthetase (AMP-forming)/AMP-acid ligase II